MAPVILFSARQGLWERHEAPLRAALEAAGLGAARLCREASPETVDYIVYAPPCPLTDFRPYRRCKAVLSLWAGVEDMVANPTLTQPLCRMVDPGLRQAMIEWVVAHTLRHHLGLDAVLAAQNGRWEPRVPPHAPERRVTVFGLGALGAACAEALAFLGFDTAGWSRSPRTIEGLTCFHGPEGFPPALARSDIAVVLLPLTADTRDLFGASALAALPRDAVLLNAGRGALVDDGALLDALDSGQLAHATLDVFRQEPLPPDHPFWAHPHVTVSPHVAAETNPHTAAPVIAENVRRGEAGQRFLHLVDRAAGY